MKKLIVLLLVLTMVCASFAGCAQPATETAADSNAAADTATEPAAAPAAEGAQEPTKLTLILRGGTYGEVIKLRCPNSKLRTTAPARCWSLPLMTFTPRSLWTP
jgi:hypothetical protein